MNNHIQLYTPHSKQLAVHEACNNPDLFFISVNAGRQSGKTALSQQQAIKWALDSSNVIVYWVSPTASQADKVYKQMLKMIDGQPFMTSSKGGQGDTEIVMYNGSKIQFRSSAQEDSLRGETIEYLIIDEAAFQKESVFFEILLPMLNVRGRKVLVVSTPKGKNWFFNMIQKGNVDSKYKSFLFTSYDNPYSNIEVINLAKASMPAVLFAQEYMGEFVDNSAIFENLKELCNIDISKSKTDTNNHYYIGIDIALKDDYTVITVIDKDDNVVWYDRFNQCTAPQLKQRIIDANNVWKPKKIMIEENNQGLPIIDDLKIIHKLNNIVGFKTTGTSKPEIINNLINAFASKKIRVPNDAIYISELETFTMTISPTGKPKFAASHGFHDDIPMSLAITWECKNKYKYSGSYNFI
tara:strand:+ start:2626 stop:3855 length:1230 start_codon:yes stop_codon:yes gene_type:complete